MSKQLEVHYKIMSMIDKCQKTVHLDPPGNHTTSKIICKITINKKDFGQNQLLFFCSWATPRHYFSKFSVIRAVRGFSHPSPYFTYTFPRLPPYPA